MQCKFNIRNVNFSDEPLPDYVSSPKEEILSLNTTQRSSKGLMIYYDNHTSGQ